VVIYQEVHHAVLYIAGAIGLTATGKNRFLMAAHRGRLFVLLMGVVFVGIGKTVIWNL
tara:strand:- start:6334 stop:6507 length:174 start_codon:yes stop_codon:yes gene_type:complete